MPLTPILLIPDRRPPHGRMQSDGAFASDGSMFACSIELAASGRVRVRRMLRSPHGGVPSIVKETPVNPAG